MFPFAAIEKAIIDALPSIVSRHREAGLLTWRLLHQIEEEVFVAIGASERYDPKILRMLKSSPAMGYPKDDRIADVSKHEVCPVAFSAVMAAWQHVH